MPFPGLGGNGWPLGMRSRPPGQAPCGGALDTYYTEAFEARYLELLERCLWRSPLEARDALNHRIGGFIEAGLLLEITSAERLKR